MEMRTMARPSTLVQAAKRIAAGEAWDFVWAGFLDCFYLERDDEARRAMLRSEPTMSGNEKLDCFTAATAEYLWKQHGLGSPVPSWIMKPERVLREPWFATNLTAPAIREYLSFASPAEFIHHNIFTDEAPLRRARQFAHPSRPKAGNVSSSQ
jgi:hypothetical protein